LDYNPSTDLFVLPAEVEARIKDRIHEAALREYRRKAAFFLVQKVDMQKNALRKSM